MCSDTTAGYAVAPRLTRSAIDCQRVAGAASAARIFSQRSTLDQVENVAIGRVLRALGELCPFRSRELALETVEQPVQHLDLSLVQRLSGETLPEPSLVQHEAESVVRPFDRTEQTTEKPFLPGCNVQTPFLGLLQHVVVVIALAANLRGHAVKALACAFCASERHVCNRARDPAVAVIERMDGDEPKVPQPRYEQPVRTAGLRKPLEKRLHVFGQPIRWRRLVVNLLPADPTRNHLHGSGAVIAPITDRDSRERASPGWEQRGMPAEQSFLGQRSCVLAGRIHHQLDYSVDIAVGGHETADVEAKLSGDGRSDLRAVQFLAFDLARLDDVFRQGAKVSFAAQAKAQA